MATPGRAGWYPDPAGRFDTRYWDGNNWTPAIKRGEQVESDPDPVPAEFSAGDPASPTIPPPLASGPAAGLVAPPPWPGGAPGDRQTSLPPPDAQREIARVLPLAGIPVQYQQPGLVQAAVPVKGETNVALVIVLCFACLIPGIIYAITSSRTRMLAASIHLIASSPGTTAITIQAAPVPRQAVLSALAVLP